jgi:uncharacterized protein (TIGR02271 family)
MSASEEELEEETVTVPIAEERLRIAKREVQSQVRIRRLVDETSGVFTDTLEHHDVSISRVAIGREVREIPEVRREGDVLVIPVVEETLVVEKRLVLREEVRVATVRRTETTETPYTLRKASVVVERQNPAEEDPS